MRQRIPHAQPPAEVSGVDYYGRPKRSVPSGRTKSGQLQLELTSKKEQFITAKGKNKDFTACNITITFC